MRRGIGRLRAGGGGVSLPTPTAMEAWFRKGVGVTSAVNAVSNWANQAASGSARDYAQATGANQPTLQGDGTILFNGSSHFLKTAAFTLNQPTTRYFRLKIVTWVASRYIADGNTLDAGSFYLQTASPGLGIFAGNALGPDNNGNVGAFMSVALVYNGASSLIRVGASAGTAGAAGAANMGGLTLGAQPTGSVPSNIQVAEEIVYSAAHNTAQQDAIIAYLNTL